ncbi:MAG: hypothetical protein CMP10_05565 [Zetaproteobacteria bacterium]|nr:hypothetical protein [Pseudobdellovibrionaceae bacterium]
MNFIYEKINKDKERTDSHWTANSDLFMVLAFLFLLLYVVSSFRYGATALFAMKKVDQARDEMVKLSETDRIYDSVKEEYLGKGATEKERSLHNEVIEKLSILRDKSQKKQDDLQRSLDGQKEKTAGLNRYQKIIKGIIAANLVANKKLKDQSDLLGDKESDLKNMRQEVRQSQLNLEKKSKDYLTAIEKIRVKDNRISNQAKKLSKNKQKIAQALVKQKKQYDNQISGIRNKHNLALIKKDEQLSVREAELKQNLTNLAANHEKSLSRIEATKRRREEQNREKILQMEREYQKKVDLLGQNEQKIKQRNLEDKQLAESQFSQEMKKVRDRHQEELDLISSTNLEKIDEIKQRNNLTKQEMQKALTEAQKEYEKSIKSMTVKNQQKLADLSKERQRNLIMQDKKYKSMLKDHNNLMEKASKQRESERQEIEHNYRKELASIRDGKLKDEKKYTEKISGVQKDYENRLNKMEEDIKISNRKAAAEIALAEANNAKRQVEIKDFYKRKLDDVKAESDAEKNKLAEKLSKQQDEFSSQVASKDQDNQKLQDKLSVAEQRNDEYSDKIGDLSTTLKTEAEAKQQLENQLGKEKQKYTQLKGYVKENNTELADRLKLAEALKDDLAPLKPNCDVNERTGDLVIDFGSAFFDTNSFTLKPKMISILRSVFPQYARRVFELETINRVTSIEIIGFASPTFKGRVVDPQSLHRRYRESVNYNLDLSYKRAREVFRYIFNKSNMDFPYQDDLLPLIKITGRSYFTDSIAGKNPDYLNRKDFCNTYGCLNKQKVMIRFTFTETR